METSREDILKLFPEINEIKNTELREKVMKMYPRSSPTPFPWEFSIEPKFEKEKT